jgi:hypothetical protein
MPITYTNRKGFTYTLCQGTTKTGKPRYNFMRDPEGKRVVDEIPEGYEISESVNGIVSLIKKRPAQILPEEVAAVEAAVKQHPKSRNYRVNVRHDQIQVYESVGPDAQDLITALSREGFVSPNLADRIHAERERYAQFTPVLRFILADAETRSFGVQRWCYRGSIDDWIDVGASGSLDQLARQLIPTLGTDKFFELY